MWMYAVFLNHMLFINVRKFSGVVKILVQYQSYGKFQPHCRENIKPSMSYSRFISAQDLIWRKTRNMLHLENFVLWNVRNGNLFMLFLYLESHGMNRQWCFSHVQLLNTDWIFLVESPVLLSPEPLLWFLDAATRWRCFFANGSLSGWRRMLAVSEGTSPFYSWAHPLVEMTSCKKQWTWVQIEKKIKLVVEIMFWRF